LQSDTRLASGLSPDLFVGPQSVSELRDGDHAFDRKASALGEFRLDRDPVLAVA
jgi:hypothetical protein